MKRKRMCKKKLAGRRKGWLAILLAAVLVFILLPEKHFVQAAGTVPPGSGTLQTAIDGAGSGDTLLLEAGDYTGPIVIPAGKSLTIQGPDSGTANITASGAVTVTIQGAEPVYFKGVTITNNGTRGAADTVVNVVQGVSPQLYFEESTIYAASYGINVSGGSGALLRNMVLQLDKSHILNPTISDYDTEVAISMNSRGIRLMDIGSGSVLTMEDSSIKGFGYGINSSAANLPGDSEGFNVNLRNSMIAAWGCLNIWSANTIYNISDSTLLGINTSTSPSNGFAVIALNNGTYQSKGVPPANVFNISDTTIKNYMPDPETAGANGVKEQLIRVENEGHTNFNLENVIFEDNTGIIDSVFYSYSMPGMPAMTDEELAAYVYSNVEAVNVVVKDPLGNITPLAPIIAPSELSISNEELTLYERDTHTLSVTPTPEYADDGVEWTSSDDTIASVDENGLITALKAGDVTITATAKTVPEDESPATAQCALKVVAAVEPVVLSLAGLPDNNTMAVGESITLVPQSAADDNTGSTGWEWDEKYFDASFNSPATFTAKMKGTTEIIYTASDGQTVTETITIVSKAGEKPTIKKGSKGVATGDTGGEIIFVIILVAAIGAAIGVKQYRRSQRLKKRE